MKDCICLDDFFGKSDKDLYNKLQSIYQEVYPNNYKLFIEYNTDIINNSDYYGKYLNLLVQYVKMLDIPVFFIEIISSYENLDRDLSELSHFYKIEKISHSISNKNFTIVEDKKNTFCILPWIHFYFNPQGKIMPCCVADEKFDFGTYTQGNIDFNSSKIKEFRQSLIDNKEVPHCSTCYNQEKNNILSHREKNNFSFNQYFNDSLSDVVLPFKIRYLDIRLSNVCNMKCRMCSGKFSNKIANEDYKIWGISEHLHNSNFSNLDKVFLNLVSDHLDHLDEIYFAGGEPLVNDIHYQILNFLLENDKINMNITYNTNFSILKYKSHDIMNYWKKFKNVTVNASIDLIGKASSYVRHGAEYSTLENNYFHLKKECPHVNFKISSVLSIYNVFNLCTLQKHWINNINLSCKQLKFNILIDPSCMSLKCLPAEFKSSAIETINDHIEFLKGCEDSVELIKSWQNAINFMLTDDHSHLLKEFFQSNDQRDVFRKQYFEDYFPEYKNLRNYAK
jgi:organic radical activating enzyme